MEPDPKAIVDESLEVQKEFSDVLKESLCLVDGNVEVGDRRCGGHSHRNSNKLADKDVTEAHPIVVHHDCDGVDQCLGEVLGWSCLVLGQGDRRRVA